jgi:SAM-dependent methyltransferase
MRLTGERPIAGKTPDSLLALHAAGYREVAARAGPGALLDLGCGVGDGSARFLGGGRRVTGIDYDPATAAEAAQRHPGLVTVCSDAGELAVRTGAFNWVCSSHLIEHFRRPERHAAEVSRVLAPGGVAFFITPNAPADFENPYHVHLFEPDELGELLGRYFGDVQIWGLDGDAVVKADFERRRRLARWLLAADVFDVRHRLSHERYVQLHAAGRRAAYPLLALAERLGRRGDRGTPERITDARFSLVRPIDPTTLVLFAVARKRTVPTGA